MIRLFLLCLSLLLPASARAAWGEATSANFIVYGEGSRERLVKFATELEQFDQLMRTVTNSRFERSPARLKVFLVGRGNEVRRLMDARGSGALGVYVPDKEGPFFLASTGTEGGAFAIDGPHVLRHEYVHHFMLQNAPAYYPVWYREGFAEYYATAKFDEPTVATIGTPPESRLGTIFYGDWGRYEDILSYDGSSKKVGADHLYAQGWLLVHAMSSDKALAAQVHRYLVAINGGKTPAEAYRATFGETDLDTRLARYFRSKRLPAIRMTLRRPIDPGSISYRQLGDAEGAMIEWDIRAAFADKAEEKAKLAREFRSAAGRRAGDPAVLRTTAEIEHAAGNHAGAMAAVDKLLQLRPDDPRGLLRKGMILVDMAERDKASAAQWTEARSWIIKANAKSPDNALILFQYYDSFPRAGQAPPKDASAALVRAFELVPQDSDLRLATGIELERVGRLAEARVVIEPLAYAALPREEKQKKGNDEDDEEEREYREKVKVARELLDRLNKAPAATG